MNRQCELYRVTQLDHRMKMMAEADPRLQFFTHVNKGKKYPYASDRQNKVLHTSAMSESK